MRILCAIIVIMIIGLNLSLSSNNEWYNFDFNNSPAGLYNRVPSIAVDSNNFIYFATIDGGIIIYNWIKWSGYSTFNSGLISNAIDYVSFDRNWNLWCGTNLGAERLENGKWTVWNRFNSGLTHDEITSISIDSLGGIWFGCEYGLNYFDGNIWHHYNGYNFDDNMMVNCTTVDNDNNVWIGTFYGTLMKYQNNSFNIISPDNFLPYLYSYPYTVRAITKDNYGKIWLTPNQGIAKQVNDTTFLIYDMANSDIPSNYIYCLNVDKENNIWIGSDSGLTKFDGTNFITYNTSNSPIPSNFVKAIAIDSLGHKWISCRLPWLGESRISVFREGGTLFTTDVNDETDENNFIISPNPAFSNINISYNLSTVADIKITILNTLGNEVSELVKNNISPGYYTENIKTLNLPSGTYFARINVNNKLITRKINLIK